MSLVLSRRTGEAIVIRDNIIITIGEIRGSRVSLAIDAPRSVHVRRKELRPHVDRKDGAR